MFCCCRGELPPQVSKPMAGPELGLIPSTTQGRLRGLSPVLALAPSTAPLSGQSGAVPGPPPPGQPPRTRDPLKGLLRPLGKREKRGASCRWRQVEG